MPEKDEPYRDPNSLRSEARMYRFENRILLILMVAVFAIAIVKIGQQDDTIGSLRKQLTDAYGMVTTHAINESRLLENCNQKK